ncbi:hypothetical protein BBK36DRAFT_1141850 [Trichoderma citrinoviride]|uniref:Uncharacterized protein n=1 Tax=Trichoderma citrinoviride TaxID=58853 RepID=A0A2T4B9D8_9HYPO|nr:hypothetical protein BBK36DRAFT_1141850 [Trichoderma citrinoviride]PTB65930.1 hypothetical protein BBK36DRAFT_1141850 [Trichoderma citrinoviride]
MRPTTGTGREEEAGETTEQMPVCSSSGSGSGPKRGLSSAQKQPSAIYVARGATTGRLDMEMGRDAKASLSPLGSCRPKVDKGGNHPAVLARRAVTEPQRHADQNARVNKRVCSGSSSRIPGGGHGGPSLFESKVKAQTIQAAAHHTTRRAKLNVVRRREGSWHRPGRAVLCLHLCEADEKPSRAEPGRAQTRSVKKRHREYARLLGRAKAQRAAEARG